ncbi:hypothetical protein GGI25_006048 [Coemansia spiralis]|uniref:Uncharacterized protein n=2 Tax=Coemansia TaxID=4863 RepID=A0A9W8KV70_9FUNG|nr:hypothetical protein BX070DRAFT_237504 [Coemansia spiralis]KAJ1988172.1 hypothetical protein EDC05_005437 [Coemansia umbellata]KAJ2619792.1 hypothetical protein GGI26_005554 [Coemansia sp. RSA 1358]KAJ2669761.1 hypothetical protein GGI25_006048 [Coemansia spiralis]
MLRGFVLTLVFFILALQVLASLFETALYAGEKVFLDHNNLAYTKGWLYYFKWVVKPLSAFIAIVMLVSTMCSCCCGGSRRYGSGRVSSKFGSVLGFFSLIFTVLWAIIVGFQVRNSNKTVVQYVVSSITNSASIVYPLGDGFSFKNDCKNVPFTLVDHGETACKLLKAESAVAIACLGLWALTLIMSFFLCCIARRRVDKAGDVVYAPGHR